MPSIDLGGGGSAARRASPGQCHGSVSVVAVTAQRNSVASDIRNPASEREERERTRSQSATESRKGQGEAHLVLSLSLECLLLVKLTV